MTSFIVVSKDKTQRDEYLKIFYKKHTIDGFDITIIGIDNSVKQNTQSIGIEDIKHMQKKIFLKPLRNGNKAVVLEDAQLLTIEAQNALLKVLEEPPQHTFIVLSTETKETLLPTIISRCFVIDLAESTKSLSEKEQQEMETFLDELPKWGIGERLKKAESLAKDKDKTIIWTGKVIGVLREKMLQESDNKHYFYSIKAFQSLHTLLKTTNVNTRFAIEQTLLSLS